MHRRELMTRTSQHAGGAAAAASALAALGVGTAEVQTTPPRGNFLRNSHAAPEQLDAIQTPVLAIYAELDRALSLNMPAVISGLLTKQKKFAFRLYEGVGWIQTLAWFDKFLRR